MGYRALKDGRRHCIPEAGFNAVCPDQSEALRDENVNMSRDCEGAGLEEVIWRASIGIAKRLAVAEAVSRIRSPAVLDIGR